MDGSRQQDTGGLEDQIRNMILSQGSGHDGPQPASMYQDRRMPSYGRGGTTQGFARQPQDRQWRGNSHPSEHHRSRFFPQDGQGSPRSTQPYQRNRQTQANGQHPTQAFQHGQGFPPQGFAGQQNRNSYQQSNSLDPNAFQRGMAGGFNQHAQQRQRLYSPAGMQGPPPVTQSQQHQIQAQHLELIAAHEIPIVEMTIAERSEKEAFRRALQEVCEEVCQANPERLLKVSIECFGSFQSGFASAGSDMDLVLVVQGSSPETPCFSLFEDDLPRALEKRLLQLGFGARLLTRTRVPIIKVCQLPSDQLLSRLREERGKWDASTNEQKYPNLKRDEDEPVPDDIGNLIHEKEQETDNTGSIPDSVDKTDTAEVQQSHNSPDEGTTKPAKNSSQDAKSDTVSTKTDDASPRVRRDQHWARERKAGPLDFPKTGVGIQSDINFFNPLGLHNTQLLRCYSLCDSRVRPMVLFVKSWAKRRKINSAYNGTLSSYGYVLMVLHYLINIASPPVLPNLQLQWRPHAGCTPHHADSTTVDGWEVDFWRREDEIINAALAGALTSNKSSLGALLAGFFSYYASQGPYPTFHWMQNVLSLRTPGGIQRKEEKGWVRAVTEQSEGKQVQHRYLFCIEDPFELSHNVARTVTHFGIVAVRDEFRRANRILRALSQGLKPRDGELFDDLVEQEPAQQDHQTGVTSHAEQPSVPVQHRSDPARALPTPRSQLPNLSDKQDFPSLGGSKPTPSQPSSDANKPARAAAGPARGNNSAIPTTKPQTQKQRRRQQQQHKLDSSTTNQNSGEGEISGERAKMYLEELRRKQNVDSSK